MDTVRTCIVEIGEKSGQLMLMEDGEEEIVHRVSPHMCVFKYRDPNWDGTMYDEFYDKVFDDVRDQVLEEEMQDVRDALVEEVLSRMEVRGASPELMAWMRPVLEDSFEDEEQAEDTQYRNTVG